MDAGLQVGAAVGTAVRRALPGSNSPLLPRQNDHGCVCSPPDLPQPFPRLCDREAAPDAVTPIMRCDTWGRRVNTFVCIHENVTGPRRN